MSIDIEETFDAAAATFDSKDGIPWHLYGARLVELAEVGEGNEVLDVACGTGSSVIAAARRVTPAGSVKGVDLSAEMLKMAQAKIEREGFHWVELKQGNMASLKFAPNSFDVVQCGFGLFFLDGVATALRSFWDLLRGEGRLAFSTWKEGMGGGFMEYYFELLAEYGIERRSEAHWKALNEVEKVAAVLSEAGITGSRIVEEDRPLPVKDANGLWTFVMGSGLKRYVANLEDEQTEKIRLALRSWASDNEISELPAPVIYAVATKPLPR